MEKELDELLKEERYNFIKPENINFILEFTKQIKAINYNFDGDIRNGGEWGNYQIIYSLNGIRGSRSIIARIIIRDTGTITSFSKEYKFKNGIVLRLYFSNINKHINYIINAQKHIKERFVNNTGMCRYCTDGSKYQCYKRKIYTIDGKEMVKCRDTFEFIAPKNKDIKDYIDILKEFYGKKLIRIKNKKPALNKR